MITYNCFTNTHSSVMPIKHILQRDRERGREREMLWVSSVTSRCGRGIEAAASELSGNRDSRRH